MTTAKLFQNGRSQAVRLPKEYRFDDLESEVIIKKLGKAVILISKSELKSLVGSILITQPRSQVTAGRMYGSGVNPVM